MKSQRGQALVEGAVALVLLSTVLAAIPCLAGYHDVQRAALRAARDASYMAGWAGMAEAATVSRRSATVFADVPWAHPRDGERWLSGDDAASTDHADSAPPGRAAALMDFIAKPLGESAGLLGGAFELNRSGYHTLRVTAAVPALRGAPAPFSELQLSLEERSAVLTESWNAGTPEQVVARVKPLVPSAQLQPLVEPMQVLAVPLKFIEPAFAQLCVGRIEPDRVPEMRLGDRIARRAAEEQGGPCK